MLMVPHSPAPQANKDSSSTKILYTWKFSNLLYFIRNTFPNCFWLDSDGCQLSGYFTQLGQNAFRLSFILFSSSDKHATNQEACNKYMAPIANAQLMQNACNPGKIVTAPMPNANISVKDVTVIATPKNYWNQVRKWIDGGHLSVKWYIRGTNII